MALHNNTVSRAYIVSLHPIGTYRIHLPLIQSMNTGRHWNGKFQEVIKIYGLC